MRWWWSPFVLDQHTELDFYSASSLKQQSADRPVAPLGYIILMPSQPVFSLNAGCLDEKQHIPILWSLVWPDQGSNPRSTALEASTLTIRHQCGLFILLICFYYIINNYDKRIYFRKNDEFHVLWISGMYWEACVSWRGMSMLWTAYLERKRLHHK